MIGKRRVVSVLVVYIALITLLSLLKLSVPEVKTAVLGFDKIVHFCFYFGLNTLLITALIAYKVGDEGKYLFLTTLLAIFYGVAIEFIQKYVGRDFDIYDIVANSLGAISAAIVVSFPQIKRVLYKHIY